ncbi:ABC-2 family transporter protein [Roseimaritima multifibrata]|uniref:ABC-2 family transporter protein n=1 Tax=Roseimaritima multifibrata TaxID=1930274 RepID=A0A517MJJ7_9BACT|nr:ABC transporter permease subunit [Roseimaritima multifibrata]QDS95053.1 ABC-2 family transporter protein [Roseimaritima multifibrata]
MIDRVLCKKYVGQASLLWLACGLALFAFAWIRVWVVSLLDMQQFATILKQFRDFEKYSPIPFDQLITYPGRIGATFDEPIIMVCIVVWSVARGSDVVSGELGRGTLEMLLAQPISRTRLLLSHIVVSTLGLLGLVCVIWLGMWIGIATTVFEETVPQATIRIPFINFEIPLENKEPETISVTMSDRVDAGVYAASVVNLFAFGFFVLGLSTLMSSWDRYRWRTIGLVIGFYVLQSVMYGLGKTTEKLAILQQMTFLTCYRPQQFTVLAGDPTGAGVWRFQATGDEFFGPMVYPLILMVLGTIAFVLADRIFNRRDLPAPL